MTDTPITRAIVAVGHTCGDLAQIPYAANQERHELHKVVKRTLAILTDSLIDDRQKVDQASQLVVKTLATLDARRADNR